VSYTWTFTGATPPGPGNTLYTRGVLYRDVDANDGSGSKRWTYTLSTQGTATLDTVSDPQGNQIIHTFTCCSASPSNPQYETQTQFYDAGGALMKTVGTTYSYALTQDQYTAAFPVYQVPMTITTTWPGNILTQTCLYYDNQSQQGGCGNVQFSSAQMIYPNVENYSAIVGSDIERDEYDYGNGAPGALLRRTQTQYQWQLDTSYFSAGQLDRPATITIYDGTGVTEAKTTLAYDEPAYQSSCASNPCGDLTTVRKYVNSSSSVSTHYAYNSQAMLTAVIDPNGNQTTYAYDSTGAFLSTVNYPAVNVAHIEYFNYDGNTGLMISHADQNSQTTSYTYDAMRRMTNVQYPDGGQDSYSYYDSPSASCSGPYFVFSKKIDGTRSFSEIGIVDGLARKCRTEVTSDPEGVDYTDTTYDALGRVDSVSNPYRSPSDPTYGNTIYHYDALNRTTQITKPSGGSVTHSYNMDGTRLLVQENDEAGDTRNTWLDALGRANQVNVFPNSVTRTQYYYDALNNLTKVDESGSNWSNDRVRTFSYDWLSRLTSSTNPESATTSYTYDSNGNMLTRTRPQANQTNPAVTTLTTYHYDGLNRLTEIDYSDGTPSKQMFYDALYDPDRQWNANLSNTIGRLTGESVTVFTGSLAGQVFGYDPMGRITLNVQCTPASCYANYHEPGGPYPQVNYPLTYSYDLAGNLISVSNGTGVTLSYSYDTASRPTSVTSSWSDSQHPATLAQ
jgi:YD repeat-containing protein